VKMKMRFETGFVRNSLVVDRSVKNSLEKFDDFLQIEVQSKKLGK